MKKSLLLSILFIAVILAQNPDPAFNPMTAPGASGINTNSHTLFWKNPSGILYNECYFSYDSILVAAMDPSVKIQSGYPSTVYDSLTVTSLLANNSYFWRVLEFNVSGSKPSPVWQFRTQPAAVFSYEYHFNSGLEGFTFAGPAGAPNWHWYNSSGAGGNAGELVFSWDPVFVGDSYMKSPEIPAPAGLSVNVNFKFYEDWWSNIVTIGSAYSTGNGYNWTSIWEIQASGNVGPDIVNKNITVPGNFNLGFYYTGNSNDIDFYRIDDIYISSSSSVASPPSFLKTDTNLGQQKVYITWNNGTPSGSPITGYYIDRKEGLPGSNSTYLNIAVTGSNIFAYEDINVDLNQSYTYRVRSVSDSGSYFGNEATAYVPAAVPVELVSLTAEVHNNDVVLKWETASEKNNKCFEVERALVPDNSIPTADWKTLAVITGAGTSVVSNYYTYTDRDVQPGKYNYRLKQVDLNGTFDYSGTVEASAGLPAEFALHQNYPNPFNPVTTIEFSLPVEENVKLSICSLLGEELIVLINERMSSGTHKYTFDASSFPSGIYIYRIKAGTFLYSRKMVLLK
jgi:hypothetical protein